MMSQPGKQTIAIHILLNIFKSKANQAIKFGQLIEYNMKNRFPRNCRKLRKSRKRRKISQKSPNT